MPFASDSKLYLFQRSENEKRNSWATVVGLENCMTEDQENFPGLFGVYHDASLSERVTHLEFNASRKV